ncbi:DUF1648 domain-containing protein [bacterium]|nr:DUF1648 domain-containing protein [bacterium]
MKARRSLALGVVPALLVVATILPMALFWGDLPNPMATHWDLSGTPNGSMPPALLLVVMMAIFCGIWAAVARAALRMPAEGPSFTAVLWFVGALLVVVQWMGVLANRDVAAWQNAGEVGLLQVAIAIAAGMAAGVLGWLMAGGSSPRPAPAPGPALDVQPGLEVVWTGQRTSWPLVVAGFGLIVAGIVMWGAIALVLGIVGLLLIVFSKVTVTTGPGGVVVTLGWLGFVSWRVPSTEITGASTEEVRPLSYGGWGYRARPGVRAIVVSGGEGIRIDRSGKPALVITVDGADIGAGAINAAAGARSG